MEAILGKQVFVRLTNFPYFFLINVIVDFFLQNNETFFLNNDRFLVKSFDVREERNFLLFLPAMRIDNSGQSMSFKGTVKSITEVVQIKTGTRTFCHSETKLKINNNLQCVTGVSGSTGL